MCLTLLVILWDRWSRRWVSSPIINSLRLFKHINNLVNSCRWFRVLWILSALRNEITPCYAVSGFLPFHLSFGSHKKFVFVFNLISILFLCYSDIFVVPFILYDVCFLCICWYCIIFSQHSYCVILPGLLTWDWDVMDVLLLMRWCIRNLAQIVSRVVLIAAE